MKNNAQFGIFFDGPAFKSGEMDIGDLTTTLLAADNLLRRANLLLNGDKVDFNVKVKGNFKSGSFGVEIATDQSLLNGALSLFSGNPLTKAAEIITILGFMGVTGKSLLGALQNSKGRNIIKEEKFKEGFNVTYEDGEIEFMSSAIHTLHKDPDTRKNIEDCLTPLKRDGVDYMSLGSGKKTSEENLRITQEELSYFDASSSPRTLLGENKKRMNLHIVNLTFKENNMWKFHDGSKEFHARIEDDVFMKKVVRGEKSFSNGVMLDVDLLEKQFIKEGRLSMEKIITHVYGDSNPAGGVVQSKLFQ